MVIPVAELLPPPKGATQVRVPRPPSKEDTPNRVATDSNSLPIRGILALLHLQQVAMDSSKDTDHKPPVLLLGLPLAVPMDNSPQDRWIQTLRVGSMLLTRTGLDRFQLKS